MSKPLLKWAGGKTQLLPQLKEKMPVKYNVYCEPFFGSGALFFDISPKKAIINDFNSQLVMLYINLKDNNKELKNEVDKIVASFNNADDKKKFYYDRRDEYNKKIDCNDIRTSALLVFLNKTCFNGLYRTNSKGQFNVPFSNKNYLNALTNDFDSLSKMLNKSKIYNVDFETACIDLKKSDFVYFDPPYFNTFENYQAEGFNIESQTRLANLFKKLSDKGVYCMLSNSNEKFIKELYKDFNIYEYIVHRNINRNGNARYGKEILVTNYENKK